MSTLVEFVKKRGDHLMIVGAELVVVERLVAMMMMLASRC